MKKLLPSFVSIFLLTGFYAGAHCQVPCGIYGDTARIDAMEEHVTTIEKSMNEISGTPLDSPQNINQSVRWVNNKEEYADKLTDIVTAYFLAQRIKASEPADKYITELKLLHGMMVASMKCKQTVDLKYVEELRNLIHQFEQVYLGEAATAPINP